MIAWSIEAAIRSEGFDCIVITTDDLEIANIARILVVYVPFIRPRELSGDFTDTLHCRFAYNKFFKNPVDFITRIYAVYMPLQFWFNIQIFERVFHFQMSTMAILLF